MNSFQLSAIGNLARNPELVAKGGVSYTRFCLIGDDYAGKNDDGSARQIISSVWFVAFGSLGESIANYGRKGDQMIIDARVRSNNWTDDQGEKQYDYSFVVETFRFGAPGKEKREELEMRRDTGQSQAPVSNVA
jgi:single-strand DNA-binding protein